MNNDSLNLLKRAVQCRTIGDYGKAKEYLDKLLEADPENHTIWYEKSKIPIVQEDNITIRSRNVSLSTYQKLSLAEKNYYLQQCGFDISEITEIESSLKIPNLVAEQRIKYLKMAISYTPESEIAVYTAELATIAAAAAEKSQKDTKMAVFVGVIALIINVAMFLLINNFHNTAFFQMPMNTLIVLLIPYALSVIGMVLYTKAKNGGNGTVSSLVCNLLSLIISNLTIINTIFLFFFRSH